MTTPAGYPSPSYVHRAAPPATRLHRTEWNRFVAVVGAVVIAAAVIGTAISFGATRFANSRSFAGLMGASSSPSPSASAVASPAPTPTTNGVLVFPSPYPALTPTPPAGRIESSSAVSLPLPDGWTVSANDGSAIALNSPNGDGSITVASGTSSPNRTAEQFRDTVDAYFTGRYPDTAPCPNSRADEGSLGGVRGIFWVLCFTMTAGDQSFPAAVALFAGSNSSGSVYYAVSVLGSRDNLQSLLDASRAAIQGIEWKLK